MANGSQNSSSADRRTELASDRTDWAEDRTIMANERTFAGWMRTGLASVGVGLGFQALFRQSENILLAKSTASVFVAIGVLIFVTAYLSAARVIDRLNDHTAEPIPRMRLLAVAGLFSLGAASLGVTLWLH